MSELGKPILKQSDQKTKKKTENKYQNATFEQKPLARKKNLVKKPRPSMNNE